MEYKDEKDFKVVLSNIEKVKCLQEINKRLKKVLYVYEKSKDPESPYNYKIYIGGLMIFVSSSNLLFNGELVNILINLNAIFSNDFNKKEIKKLTFESINYVNYLYDTYAIKTEENEEE